MALEFLWREWFWSWNSSTLATSCGELTHWKTLMLGGIRGRRRRGRPRIRWLDGITDSMDTVWVNSGSWWWTGRPGVLQFMGLQRAGHDWATELNWTELNILEYLSRIPMFLKSRSLYIFMLAVEEIQNQSQYKEISWNQLKLFLNTINLYHQKNW